MKMLSWAFYREEIATIQRIISFDLYLFFCLQLIGLFLTLLK
ncbi:unnamed protein product [Brassica rapa]|uniref:Uncharacterized protein n=1 Tax=Brassica campestris TaxID=3711 RepID=A0A8D9D7D2_BRACM|nr:unnamed protein product [Brassica rapa]